MHHTAQRRPQPLPAPEVIDSDVGAFLDACQQLDADPAAAAPSAQARHLLAALKAQHTVDGYTSWPAYADALEQAIIGLTSDGGRA